MSFQAKTAAGTWVNAVFKVKEHLHDPLHQRYLPGGLFISQTIYNLLRALDIFTYNVIVGVVEETRLLGYNASLRKVISLKAALRPSFKKGRPHSALEGSLTSMASRNPLMPHHVSCIL